MSRARLAPVVPAKLPRVVGSLQLGMAQLCGLGLSEPWLLRDAGDRHWQMIAAELGQSGMALSDPGGRPVYAAFCTTQLQIVAHPGQLLGQAVRVASMLCQVSGARLGSVHEFRDSAGAVLARVQMVSCFLSHDESGSNRRLLRNALPGLEGLPNAPETLLLLDRQGRGMARRARDLAPGLPLLRYQPTVALDFNAVGLLYFPTYSKIAEMARPRSDCALHRQVTYLSNLDPGEEVLAEQFPQGVLLRAAQGRPLAMIASL